MGWFPSLICKNYIFKDFVITVEATSLKFCMILKLVTLHPEKTTAQVNVRILQCACANLSSIERRNGISSYLLQKAEILVVVTLDRLLSEANRLLKIYLNKLY